MGVLVTEGGTSDAIWARSDVTVLATGIYMERHRIGWWSARAALRDDADRKGVDLEALAEKIVQGLDQRRSVSQA